MQNMQRVYLYSEIDNSLWYQKLTLPKYLTPSLLDVRTHTHNHAYLKLNTHLQKVVNPICPSIIL